jgi:hypothetical protein
MTPVFCTEVILFNSATGKIHLEVTPEPFSGFMH